MAKKKKQKKKNTAPKQPSVSRPKEFLDLIAPAAWTERDCINHEPLQGFRLIIG